MTMSTARRRPADEPIAGLGSGPAEPGLVFGRPVEDRSFEAVEAGIGLAAGIALGAMFAGPSGAAVGAVVGAAGGFVAGELLERAVGRAATTTDATDPEPPDAP